MKLINERVLILRIVVIAILFSFVYPFLPDKQKWQIQSSVGIPGADSLLAESYEPPPTDGAMQFALETFFSIKDGSQRIVDANDVRYVRIVDKLWGQGKLWAVHLRHNAIEKLKTRLKKNPATKLMAALDDSPVPLDVDLRDIRSPLYIDPGLWTDDPYFVTAPLEGWYERPYMGNPAATVPNIY